MLPKTLQYSGSMPAAGTIVAEVIVVSFSDRLARLAQSAASAGATPTASEVSRTSVNAANLAPGLACLAAEWETQLKAPWRRSREFMTILPLLMSPGRTDPRVPVWKERYLKSLRFVT